MEQVLSAVASIESRVPFVYTERCRLFCNELTANHPPFPSSLTEAFRQLRNQLRSPEQAAAFIFQCLRGLGWREDLRELQRVTDRGFSLQVSYPDIWRRLSETKHDIEVVKLREIELEITSQLSGFLMFILRVALVGSLIHDPIQGNHLSFLDLFNHLLDTLKDPSLAASIVTSVLKRFEYSSESTQKLEQYAIPDFNLHQRYPEISLRLKVAEFFYTLGEQDCVLAMMILSHRYFGNRTIHDIAPLEFVLNLFNRGEDSVVKISDVSKIQNLAVLFQKPNFFNGYGNLPAITETGSSSEGTTAGAEQEVTPYTSDANTTAATPLLEGGATENEGDTTIHSDTYTDQGAVNYDANNDTVKCLMKFMIKPQHPEIHHTERLNEFLRTGLIPAPYQRRPDALSLTRYGSFGSTVIGSSIEISNTSSTEPTDPPFKLPSLKHCVPSSKLGCCVCIVLLVLLVFFFVLPVLLGLASFALHAVTGMSGNFTVPDNVTVAGTNPYPVLVPGEYSSLRLTLLSSDPVNITQTLCGDLDITFAPLQTYSYSKPNPHSPTCLCYNGNIGNNDFNLAPESQLLYNITLHPQGSSSLTDNSSYQGNDDKCLFLYLLANFGLCPAYSLQCDDVNTSTIVDQSECLKLEHNETSRTWLIQFNITEQADYTVVLKTPGLYEYRSDIYVKQAYYNVSSDDSVCQLSSNYSTCPVNPCRHYYGMFRMCFDRKNSSKEGSGMCRHLLLQSSSSSDTTVGFSPDTDAIFDINSSWTLVAAMFAFVVFLLLIISLVIIGFISCAYNLDRSKSRNVPAHS